MSEDKELLTLAAKAAGIEIAHIELLGDDGWNPLTDDGDALRLAVKLRMNVEFFDDVVWAFDNDYIDPIEEPYKDDPYAATRRAIVRAAAEIGRGME